jgi:5-methylcytosine-specific restriction endonuclease McrA
MRLIAERGRTCHWCGEDISDDELTLEHLLPRREGGGNRIENLALAHRRCNH